MIRIGTLAALLLTAAPALAAPVAPPVPPLSPEGERPVAGNPKSLAYCAEALAPLVKRLGAELGTPRVTTSAKWGQVWRVDLRLGHSANDVVNRVVCWQGHLAVALRQDLAPLDATL